MPNEVKTLNFSFLKKSEPVLASLGGLAERYFTSDPNTCLLKLRQFGEILAKIVAARTGLLEDQEISQFDLLKVLERNGYLQHQHADLFHGIRRAGNAASHSGTGDFQTALHNLKMARELAIWFARSFGGQRNLKAGPFVPIPMSDNADKRLREEQEELRTKLQEALKTQKELSLEIDEAHKREVEAAARAEKSAKERQEWEAFAQEIEIDFKNREAELQAALNEAQKLGAAIPATEKAQLKEQANEAANALDLDEHDTRRIIDQQLRDAGWEADTNVRRYANGYRPEKGINQAIAEWPTTSGPADYVLFKGTTAIAVVEAKRKNKSVSGVIKQAKRYSRDFKDKEFCLDEGPWQKYKVPFLFSTNGRPFLKQLEHESGIWFLDARKATNHSRALCGWYTPEGLEGLLRQDHEKAHAKLNNEPTDYLNLRDYQLKVIDAAEKALEKGQRELLLAMATGTGKTRTCIGLAYRLLKTRRFRRVLFLVDRSALGQQAYDNFRTVRLEDLKTFAEIFDIKELRDIKPEPETKLHFATVQGMVKRILYPDDPSETPPVDQYDCIIVDECHRGYILDRLMSEGELLWRDESDYISVYRRVIEHFDAVKIGLTATPALHTTEIFGKPVYTYPLREAVIDGWLVDHEPPTRIITALAEDGMTWHDGDPMDFYHVGTGKIETKITEDEVKLDIESYNKYVYTENFNKVVCEEVAKHIDPSLPGKTLVFCCTDRHADLVVTLLKKAFQDQYGECDDDAVAKITGAADKPLSIIRHYKNEFNPRVAVTVDLLTTGVDVPEISNLVFIRRVRSRILYEQMIGRATRLCEKIEKESFRIFDAVKLYEDFIALDATDVRPVVTKPTVSFSKLAEELQGKGSDDWKLEVIDQFIVKLRAKKRYLKDENEESFQAHAGMPSDEFFRWLRNTSPDVARGWFEQHSTLPAFLDELSGGKAGIIISNHDDELRRVVKGYGKHSKPQDYLSAFEEFLKHSQNEIPALLVVTQRPRNLTRLQLKELRMALDKAGYSEKNLQAAIKAATNTEIAASIIGFIRRYALGDPLVPYKTRVDNALAKIVQNHQFTDPQREWLDRIALQMKAEVVVDRQSLDSGQFKHVGGFKRLNKIFEGRLEHILEEMNEALWQKAS